MPDESLNLPSPPVPPELDVSTFGWMPFYGDRLLGSTFNAHTTDSEWRAGVTLWWSSWKQVPAGSLPSDDQTLCRLAGLARDLRTWKKVKVGALRGFVHHSDGRLYHPLLCAWAMDAYERKRSNVSRTEAAREAYQSRQQLLDGVPPSALDQSLQGRGDRTGSKGEDRTGKERMLFPPGKPPVQLPDWLPTEAWQEFVRMRKMLKKPLTEYAKVLIVKDLISLKEEGQDPVKCLDQSSKRNWAGVFRLHEERAIARAGAGQATLEDANRAAAAATRRTT